MSGYIISGIQCELFVPNYKLLTKTLTEVSDISVTSFPKNRKLCRVNSSEVTALKFLL